MYSEFECAYWTCTGGYYPYGNPVCSYPYYMGTNVYDPFSGGSDTCNTTTSIIPTYTCTTNTDCSMLGVDYCCAAWSCTNPFDTSINNASYCTSKKYANSSSAFDDGIGGMCTASCMSSTTSSCTVNADCAEYGN